MSQRHCGSQEKQSGVYQPSAAQSVEAGSDLMIQWVYGSDLCDAKPATVDIELRDALTGFPLRTVATNAPNHGYFFWNVDRQIQPCANAVVFVGNILAPHSAPGLFSAHFTVVAPSDESNDAGIAHDAPPLWSVSADSTTATRSQSQHQQQCQEWLHHWQEQQQQQQSKKRRSDSPNLEESFLNMSLDEAQSIECDSEDSMTCAQTHQCFAAANAEHATSNSATLSQQSQSGQRRQSALSPARQVCEPIVWSHYPDFICHAMYMCDTEIRRGLRQVVKNDAIVADSLLESGERAGIFCLRYLLLRHYKTKISNDVFDAIRTKVYVPHPLLTQAWQRSPLYRASQREPVRTTLRARRSRTLARQDDDLDTQRYTPQQQKQQADGARRKQVVHALESDSDTVGRAPQRNVQTHSMRRPVTRSRVRALQIK